MGYIRFPIPSFDHKKLRGLDWTQPIFLSEDDINLKIGAKSTYGGFTVEAPESVTSKFSIRGEYVHAILCVVPSGTRIVGRSYSWWLQRALIIDSLNSEECKIICDWRTPRPMNSRFGPEEGIVLEHDCFYILSCHNHGEHWDGNRTLIQDHDNGRLILGSAKKGTNNFHEFCLTFSWSE